MRALDAGDSAAFSTIFLASSFFCSQAEYTPAPAPVTQTVKRFYVLFSPPFNLDFRHHLPDR
jgi:hypothetical protein